LATSLTGAALARRLEKGDSPAEFREFACRTSGRKIFENNTKKRLRGLGFMSDAGPLGNFKRGGKRREKFTVRKSLDAGS